MCQKSVFGKSNFLPASPLSKRPLTNNGHFFLVKVAVIERLDCTWIINRMLSGPFCIRGYHFTAKLHQIKIRLPAQINPFRFSRFVEFLIREISKLNAFWWDPSRHNFRQSSMPWSEAINTTIWTLSRLKSTQIRRITSKTHS